MLTKPACAVMCAAILAASPAVPAAAVSGLGNAAVVSAAAKDKTKDGLLKEDGSYRYYKNGKLVKSSWMTIEDETYYFKKDGNAAVLSCKIKGKYYVFDTKGCLVQPSKKKIVKIETEDGTYRKFYVNKNGTAASGWAEKKTYYFDETGEMTTGITIIDEKFYAFNSGGKFNETKTKKLRTAAIYEQPFTALRKMLGEPKKTKYYTSCYGDGRDGVLTYDGFTVYTFQPAQGTEIYMGAE